MKALFIDGRRDGYTPKQCGKTMTVAELMAYLEQFDEELPVYLINDGGYTYGSIDDYSFEESEEEQDDDEE
jgi:hypothetical protein